MSNTDKIIEQATREAGLRSQNTLLTQQYNAIHSTLVRYAEAMGRLCAVAKPVVAEHRRLKGTPFDSIHKLETLLEAFANELDQLVRKEPRDGTQEKPGTDVEGKGGEAQEGAADRGPEGAPGAEGAEATPEA